MVGALAGGNVEFNWQANTEPDVIGYNLYCGPASHTYTYVVPFGLVTNATISGLRDGTTYYFALVACTAEGERSDFSQEISQFIPLLDKSTNNFDSVSGSYNGLFFETAQVEQTTAGSFSLFVNKRGAYSGRLQSGNGRVSFAGQLDSSGRATNVIAGPNNTSLTIQFRVNGNGQTDILTGQISDGQTVSTLAADRASFNPRTAPAPFAGQYTCVLPGQGTDPSAPKAYGFGVARVSASGSATFVGTLADGTHVSQSAPVSQNGAWPFYVPLYSGKGSVISWLTFANQMNADLNGLMQWIKPAMPNTRYYASGFTNKSRMLGSTYRMPSPVTEPLLDLANTFIAFTGGDLGSGFTNAISVSFSTRVTNHSRNRLGITFSIPTGTFRGSVVDPVTGRAMPFNGVAFQKRALGYGLLFGSDQTSSVLLGH